METLNRHGHCVVIGMEALGRCSQCVARDDDV